MVAGPGQRLAKPLRVNVRAHPIQKAVGKQAAIAFLPGRHMNLRQVIGVVRTGGIDHVSHEETPAIHRAW